MAIVDKATEYYLIHSMGLTKKQIKEMMLSEIEEHCKNVVKQRIKETGIYKPEDEKPAKPTAKPKKKK